MKNRTSFIVTTVIIALLGTWTVNASKGEVATVPQEEPAHVELIEGSELSRVTLTQRAAERLDIQTAEVVDKQVDGARRSVAPYAAVLYETDGSTWVYTNPEPLVFIRHAVTIERIQGEEAILTEGPEVGTKVVSVGGAMLYGSEHGIGH